MKKLFAITLLVIYLFNLAGYLLLYEYFIARSNKQLVQQIDNHQYNENELVQVQLPLHLTYITTDGEYERVDGEIEFNGRHYNYVKRKVQNDTLYLLCLPNTAKTKLYQDRNDFAQESSVPASDKNAKPPLLKKGFPEPGQPKASVNLVLVASYIKPEFSSLVTDLPTSFIATPFHPPKSGC